MTLLFSTTTHMEVIVQTHSPAVLSSVKESTMQVEYKLRI